MARYIVYVLDENRGEYVFYAAARYTSELVALIERLTERGVRTFAVEVKHGWEQ